MECLFCELAAQLADSFGWMLIAVENPNVISVERGKHGSPVPSRVRNLEASCEVLWKGKWVPGLDNHILAVVEKLLIADPSQRMNIFMLEAITLEKTGQLPHEDAIPQS